MSTHGGSRRIGIHEHMLRRVALALGPELVAETAFVGGCATALLVTDELVQDEVRFTDDVDLIVHVIGPGQWYELERQLARRGFRSALDDQDDPVCRKRLRDAEPHELIVDFMPDDPAILSFANRWYTDALASAVEMELSDGTRVRVVTAPYFLGTKLEAYRGRGNSDPLGSRDVEDILNLVEGRVSLLDEVSSAPEDLRRGIAEGISDLLSTRNFDYAVAGAARGSAARESRIFERLELLASGAF